MSRPGCWSISRGVGRWRSRADDANRTSRSAFDSPKRRPGLQAPQVVLRRDSGPASTTSYRLPRRHEGGEHGSGFHHRSARLSPLADARQDLGEFTRASPTSATSRSPIRPAWRGLRRDRRRPAEAFGITSRGNNLVAVVTNGTAVLGLGNIGPLASKPVMEGKGLPVQSSPASTSSTSSWPRTTPTS